MVTDLNKGITVTYNHLNLPTMVNFGSNKVITYQYDALGSKVQKAVYQNGQAPKYRDYVGGIEYTTTNGLEHILTATGRIVPGSGNYVYEHFYKDQTNNVRMVFADANGDGSITTNEVLQQNNYYPYGLTHSGIDWGVPTLSNSNLNRFQEQELQEEFGLNWYHFKWRMHNPQIGRFMAVDPLSEKYVYNSTYAFSENKVVAHIELEGLEAVDVAGNLHAGPAVLQVINAEILKNHPEYMMNLEHIMNVNLKILKSGIKQDLYPLPIVIQNFQARQEQPPIIDFNMHAEAGGAMKGKARVFGFGGKVEVGVTQPLVDINFTDDGNTIDYGGKLNSSYNLAGGPIGFNLDILNRDAGFNLGPYGANVENFWTNTEITYNSIEVFEYGATVLFGVSMSLTINLPTFNPSSLIRLPLEFAPSDATSVEIQRIDFEGLINLDNKQIMR